MEDNKINLDGTVSPSTKITNLLRAAEPFLPSNITDSVDILIKMTELTASMQELQKSKNGIFAKQKEKEIDLDGLLHNIRQFCSNKEQGFIDTLLGMKNAMKMMKTYQEMMSVMSELSAAMPKANNSTSEEGNSQEQNSGGFAPEMMDVLEMMLPPEQKETFETMKLLLSSGMLQNL